MIAEPLDGERRLARPTTTESGRGVRLGPAEAAIFETFVVPRYMALFGELALEMIAESEDARLVHLGCRTGYPDRGVALKLPGTHVVGIDSSEAALELARAKAATMPGMVGDYRFVASLPAPLPSSAFSHALTLHPPARLDERTRILDELARLLAPHGQALVAMPLRGSFRELGDLLREYALKHDADEVAAAVEHAAIARPTPELLGVELEKAGFDFIEVGVRATTLRFQGGRDFFEDPIARLAVLPEVREEIGLGSLAAPLAYVRDAIDKYWSEGSFELTMNVGCATGRRRP